MSVTTLLKSATLPTQVVSIRLFLLIGAPDHPVRSIMWAEIARTEIFEPILWVEHVDTWMKYMPSSILVLTAIIPEFCIKCQWIGFERSDDLG